MHSVGTGENNYKHTTKSEEARGALLTFTTILGQPVPWPTPEEVAEGKEASMARQAAFLSRRKSNEDGGEEEGGEEEVDQGGEGGEVDGKGGEEGMDQGGEGGEVDGKGGEEGLAQGGEGGEVEPKGGKEGEAEVKEEKKEVEEGGMERGEKRKDIATEEAELVYVPLRKRRKISKDLDIIHHNPAVAALGCLKDSLRIPQGFLNGFLRIP